MSMAKILRTVSAEEMTKNNPDVIGILEKKGNFN